MRKLVNFWSGLFAGFLPLCGVLIFTIPIYDVLPNKFGFLLMGMLGVLALLLGFKIFKKIQIIGPIEYFVAVSASPDLDNLIPKAGSKTKLHSIKELVNSINDPDKLFDGGTFRIYGDWFGKPYRNYHMIETAQFKSKSKILTLNFVNEVKLEIQDPKIIFEAQTFLKIAKAKSIKLTWYKAKPPKIQENLYHLTYKLENKKIRTSTNVDYYKPIFDVSLGDPALIIYS